MESALYELLTSDPRISAAVSDRVYPLERPQGSALPAITYQRVGGDRDYDMQGATGLVESRFLIGFWGEDGNGKSGYKAAKELRAWARDLFCPDGGFRRTVRSTDIQGIFISSEDDTRQDGPTNRSVARVLLDCTFWHQEREVS